MNPEFIRKRLEELVINAELSQSKISHDLGFNRNYIHTIISGKSLPTMSAFLQICDYLKISPEEFFHVEDDNILQRSIEEYNSLSEKSKLALKDVVRKLKQFDTK
ncbi:MAG: helix-turn-helix domain-containing protein [Oscillospiraceae bacterium]